MGTSLGCQIGRRADFYTVDIGDNLVNRPNLLRGASAASEALFWLDRVFQFNTDPIGLGD